MKKIFVTILTVMLVSLLLISTTAVAFAADGTEVPSTETATDAGNGEMEATTEDTATAEPTEEPATEPTDGTNSVDTTDTTEPTDSTDTTVPTDDTGTTTVVDTFEVWTQNAYNWIISICGGLSLSAIVTAVICGVLKGAFGKTISKLNVEQITETATEKGIDRVKEISFKQSIEPLVRSELIKVTEVANDYIKAQLKETNDNYLKLVEVLGDLAAYFDNSIGVSDEAKEKLHNALLTAANGAKTVESVEVDKVVVEEVKDVPVANDGVTDATAAVSGVVR